MTLWGFAESEAALQNEDCRGPSSMASSGLETLTNLKLRLSCRKMSQGFWPQPPGPPGSLKIWKLLMTMIPTKWPKATSSASMRLKLRPGTWTQETQDGVVEPQGLPRSSKLSVVCSRVYVMREHSINVKLHQSHIGSFIRYTMIHFLARSTIRWCLKAWPKKRAYWVFARWIHIIPSPACFRGCWSPWCGVLYMLCWFLLGQQHPAKADKAPSKTYIFSNLV